MRPVGFNFDKINVEKLSDKAENIKINTKIDISEIKEIKSTFLKTKEDIVKVKFVYGINYDPEFAKIELEGNVLFSLESKKAKDLINQWKEKKISEDFKIILFNFILRKSNLKALQLEDEMNLPLHIPMPSLKKQESEDNTK